MSGSGSATVRQFWVATFWTTQRAGKVQRAAEVVRRAEKGSGPFVARSANCILMEPNS